MASSKQPFDIGIGEYQNWDILGQNQCITQSQIFTDIHRYSQQPFQCNTQSQTGSSGAGDQVLFHWQVMFHHWICSPVPPDTKRLAAPHSYLKYIYQHSMKMPPSSSLPEGSIVVARDICLWKGCPQQSTTHCSRWI